MTLTYHSFDPDFVALIRKGGPDANGQKAERVVSDGQGKPCRSCLQNTPAGEGFLILAARPFPALQPYAETGPVFLCEAACASWTGTQTPPVMNASSNYLLKAYSADFRIIYGTGQITPAAETGAYAADLLSRDNVAYVDVRSACNNCFLTRITRPNDAKFRPYS